MADRESPERDSYHHGDLRAALLRAAHEILREEGIGALSLRAAARRAGVSPGAPYHHFGGKRELVEELARGLLEQLDARARGALEGAADPREKLRAIGIDYVLYAAEHPAEFRLMFSPERGSPLTPPRPEGAPVFRVLLEVVDELRDAGLETDRTVAAITAWSLVHGLADLLVDGPLRGLATDPGRVRDLAEGVTAGLAMVERSPE